MAKKFYRKEDVLHTEIRDLRWDEVPYIIRKDEEFPVFNWQRCVDMIVWNKAEESYYVKTYPVDNDGSLRDDATIYEWEDVVNSAKEIALTDGCHSSVYESLGWLYEHVCDDIDQRDIEEPYLKNMQTYLLYLMHEIGHGFLDNDREEELLKKCKTFYQWLQTKEEPK